MNITIELKGTSPLLMHNPRMVDPEYQINREMKAITTMSEAVAASFQAMTASLDDLARPLVIAVRLTSGLLFLARCRLAARELLIVAKSLEQAR